MADRNSLAGSARRRGPRAALAHSRTGYPKGGGKLGDLGGVISITLYH